MNTKFDQILDILSKKDCFDKMLMDQIEVLEIEPTFKCIFKADKQSFTNVYNSIHGGIYSSLVDLLGGIVISLHNIDEQSAYFNKTGELIKEVSSDINISYLSSSAVGDQLYCEARLLKKGRNLAFTQVDIYKLTDENETILLATGRHTKFIFKHKL
eukprot:NODE_708_length_4951_cov_0.361500.p2 type:complete len:157 gc:universal NODE_708_length_4951_cov_0.361500:2225-1755(-)